MPADDQPHPTETCPGCGAVLRALTDGGSSHPGASPSCTRLYEVTLRGLREDAATDALTASTVALADAAYDVQHPVAGGNDRLRAALERLGATPDAAGAHRRPAWRTTVADIAADLDVIHLPVLVESWARSVREDWAAASAATD